MKSKIINLRYDGESSAEAGIQVIEKQYINRLNDVSFATATAGGFDTNYPVSNLMDYRTYKESRVLTNYTGSEYFAGFLFDLVSGFGDWNTMAIQFPKFNDIFREVLKNKDIEIDFISAGNTKDYKIIVNSNNTTETVVTDVAPNPLKTVTTGKINLKESLILIDEDITRHFNQQDFEEADYTIRISLSDASDFNYFAISNITFSNYYEVCLDSGFKFKHKSLSNVKKGKKTGVVFRELNEADKSFAGSISLMTTQEQYDLNVNVVAFNKETPFFFFGFAETNEIDSGFYEAIGLNLETGGLFNISDTFELQSKEYDIYKTSLKLTEHK